MGDGETMVFGLMQTDRRTDRKVVTHNCKSDLPLDTAQQSKIGACITGFVTEQIELGNGKNSILEMGFSRAFGVKQVSLYIN